MSVALIDDQALSLVLRGKTPRLLRRPDLATTGYWYVRLCQAVLGATERTGNLSDPFVGLPEGVRCRAIEVVLQLPEKIELVSLRELGPTIGQLRSRHTLNILGMEVVAAAIHLDADVFLSTESPRLQAALVQENRRCRLLT